MVKKGTKIMVIFIVFSMIIAMTGCMNSEKYPGAKTVGIAMPKG